MRRSFVTGASRGIGRETALALAEEGYDVALGYQTPSTQREKLIHEIEDRIKYVGRDALGIRGDLTNETDTTNTVEVLSRWSSGRLDALVLNAAGGLEKGKDHGYAMRINHDSQLALTRKCLPYLVTGSTVAYITSHWAHLYGEVELPPFDYEAVASTKHLGELALRDKQSVLSARGARLIVVTAGIVTGTFVGDQAVRKFPEFAEQQRAIGNVIPVEIVGKRIAAAIADPSLPNGHTEVIGASLELMR